MPMEKPPTSEETAEFERLMKEKPDLSAALDDVLAEKYRQELDEAVQRGENTATNLWTMRSSLEEKMKQTPDEKIGAEIQVLNVAIDELDRGDPDAAIAYYDFDNDLIGLQIELAKTKGDDRKTRAIEAAIRSMRRQKENLLKYAKLKNPRKE